MPYYAVLSFAAAHGTLCCAHGGASARVLQTAAKCTERFGSLALHARTHARTHARPCCLAFAHSAAQSSYRKERLIVRFAAVQLLHDACADLRCADAIGTEAAQ